MNTLRPQKNLIILKLNLSLSVTYQKFKMQNACCNTKTDTILFENKNFLSRTLAFPQKYYISFQRKPFKNDEKCFLFHFKSTFRFQDI